jgi:hypothetical protein
MRERPTEIRLIRMSLLCMANIEDPIILLEKVILGGDRKGQGKDYMSAENIYMSP